MSQYAWWMVVAAVLIGHFGLGIAMYNRINGLGWPRKLIKAIVAVMFLWTISLPPLIGIVHRELMLNLLTGRVDSDSVPIPLTIYAFLCLAAWIIFGVPWLLWRPIFGLEWVRAVRNVEVVQVQELTGQRLALTRQCKLESRIPLNQIFELAIEEVDLPVSDLPTSLDGYRIAHLSDIHLTGHIHPEFSRYAVERATSWQPDMMALTGDIIDRQPCVDWLPKIFAAARAADGCYYVLGNHDTRILDSKQTREAMDRAGWTDLGSRTLEQSLRDVPSLLIGNEHPWFERPQVDPPNRDVPSRDVASGTVPRRETFRLLLSHSPDQFNWARKNQVTLMLAGHTHGGQGRLPLAGPILGPSFHGSRYASGDFYRAPTTMHVSRGLCGTHLIRINCRPELSLLTLRSIPSGGGDT